MTLKELARLLAAGKSATVEIHSVDPMLYVLFARTGLELTPVTDSRGRSLTFRSRFAAQRALAGTGLEQADFVHRSSYDEMIGLQGSSYENQDPHDVAAHRPLASNELRETLDLRKLKDS